MNRIIDVHLHVGHRWEWTPRAQAVWMDTGPYVPRLFDREGNQLPDEYGAAITDEVWAGILIPEYSPQSAGLMPIERALEISRFHPELVPIANLNPTFHENVTTAFDEQLTKGARALKIHPVDGSFFANDPRLYPVYERCEGDGMVVMFHAGTSLFPGSKMRYADPYTFDDVISDFPSLKIVLCHGGRGFWYHIAEFMIKSWDNVYIDVSGLPPTKLLKYFPLLKRFSHKFLFGSDFPGVPGIRKNWDSLTRTVDGDETVMTNIGFRNAFDLFGFWREGVFRETDPNEIAEVINDGARRYNGSIPPDCWHDPYMPTDELTREMGRMHFYGYRTDMNLLGVMGKEVVEDVTLLRHAYVRRDHQGTGIGSKLTGFIEKQVDTDWLLVGTWSSATWAVDFYKKHGFVIMENKDDLLRRYWEIRDHQTMNSVVLGKRINGKR
jgi:uncharacterized protein